MALTKMQRPTITKRDWQRLAYHLAADANENNFPSRWGVWYFEDVDVLCFYDNNPNGFRDNVIAEFRKQLGAAKIKELAFATYPPVGEQDAGYTCAMIVDASRDQAEALFNLRQQTMLRVWSEPLKA